MKQEQFNKHIKRRFYLSGLEDKGVKLIWHETRHGYWWDKRTIYIHLDFSKWFGKLPKGVKPTRANVWRYKPEFRVTRANCKLSVTSFYPDYNGMISNQ